MDVNESRAADADDEQAFNAMMMQWTVIIETRLCVTNAAVAAAAAAVLCV